MNEMFNARARSQLHQWFSAHCRNPRMEIEARIKDVTKAGFEEVLTRLRSNKGWSNEPVEQETIDKMHANGVRETIDLPSKRRSFLRKNRDSEPLLVEATPEHAVRFAVSSEVECPPDDSRVVTWRRKRRVSFVHKGMFAFELTRVNQGPNEQVAMMSPMLYEVELEFCGQRLGDAMPNAGYLTDSMLMKISDLLRQLLAVSRNGLPPAKRVKTNADGGLAEGTPVKLKQGTSVTLGPSTHGQPPPYSGLLPPPAAALVPWVFSHEVPREGGKETDACIMNLPCTLEAMSLPLFYLYGHVPRDALLTG